MKYNITVLMLISLFITGCSKLPESMMSAEDVGRQNATLNNINQPLVAPTILEVKSDEKQVIKLNWEVDKNLQSSIQGFQIYLKNTFDSIYELVPTRTVGNIYETTFTNPMPHGYGDYKFKIKAVGIDNQVSDFSKEEILDYKGYKDISQQIGPRVPYQVGGNTFLYTPTDLVVDSVGNLFVTDTDNHRVLKLSPDGLILKVYGSKGTGLGEFHSPRGIDIDHNGIIMVADSANDRIVFDPNDFDQFFKVIGKAAPVGAALGKKNIAGSAKGEFDYPVDIDYETFNVIYVADQYNRRIQRILLQNYSIVSVDLIGQENDFSSIVSIQVMNDDLYVLDKGMNRVFKYAKDLSNTWIKVDTWGSYGEELGQFMSLSGITIDTKLNQIYISDSKRHDIQVMDLRGNVIGLIGSNGVFNGQFSSPADMYFYEDKLYAIDSGNVRLQVFK